jgi:hypothetical protein
MVAELSEGGRHHDLWFLYSLGYFNPDPGLVLFHIRGSKLNADGSANSRSVKSGCNGLIGKLKSSGTTAEGTKRQTEEAGTRDETSTRSHRTLSGIVKRMETKSGGASSDSRFTKYSRDAKARLDDAYATRAPGGVHLPPRRLDPSPSNAAAGGFA